MGGWEEKHKNDTNFLVDRRSRVRRTPCREVPGPSCEGPCLDQEFISIPFEPSETLLPVNTESYFHCFQQTATREVSRVGVRCGKRIGRAIRRESEVYLFPGSPAASTRASSPVSNINSRQQQILFSKLVVSTFVLLAKPSKVMPSKG